MYVNTEIADKYQEFFNFMNQEHDLTLTISEMDEIVSEAQKLVKNINYDTVLGTVDYEYEHLFSSDEGEPCPIDGWMPIATERIKHPEKIPEYIERGILRRIKPQ